MTFLARQILTKAILLIALTFFATGCQRSTHSDRPGSPSASGSSPTSGGSESDRSYQPRASESQKTYKEPRLKTPAKSESLREKLATRIRDAFNRSSIQQDEATKEYVLKGGADPSGGEGSNSDQKILVKNVKKAFAELPGVFHRAKYWFANSVGSKETYEKKYLLECYEKEPKNCKNIYKVIDKMISSFDFETEFDHKTNFVAGDCPSSQKHSNTDMSIDKNLNLCISKKLTRYPKDELYLQIVTLLSHEVVHGLNLSNKLLGVNGEAAEEDKAQELQTWLEYDQGIINYNTYQFKTFRYYYEGLALSYGRLARMLAKDYPINQEIFCIRVNDIISRFDRNSLDSHHIKIPLFPRKNEKRTFNEVFYDPWNIDSNFCRNDPKPIHKSKVEVLNLISQALVYFENYFSDLEQYFEKSTALDSDFGGHHWLVDSDAELVTLMAQSSLSTEKKFDEEVTCSIHHKGKIISENIIFGGRFRRNGFIHGTESYFKSKELGLNIVHLQILPNLETKGEIKQKLKFDPIHIRLMSFKQSGIGGVGINLYFTDDYRGYNRIRKITLMESNADKVKRMRWNYNNPSLYKVLYEGESLKAKFRFEKDSKLAGQEITVECQATALDYL